MGFAFYQKFIILFLKPYMSSYRRLILTNLTKIDLTEVHVSAPYRPPISSLGSVWTRLAFVSTGGRLGQMAQAMSAQLLSVSQRMGAKVRDGTVRLLTA